MGTMQLDSLEESPLQRELSAGTRYLQKNDFINAAPHFQKAIELDGNSFDAAQLAGMCYLQLKDLDKAFHYMKAAVELRPNDVGTLFNMGVLLSSMGNVKGAISAYERISIIEPKHAQSLYNHGILLAGLGDKERALEKYRLAIAAKPDMREALLNAGAVLQGLGRHEEAIAIYRDLLKNASKDASVLNNLGTSYHEIKAFSQAIDCYEQAIAVEPSNSQVIFNLGLAHHQMRHFESAIEQYTKALTLRPDVADWLNSRGNAFKELKRFDEAMSDFDRAGSLSPLNALVKNNRANALMEVGRIELAIASYQAALGLQPHYAEARHNLALCQLLHGNYLDGWRDFEWRWKIPAISKKLSKRSYVGNPWLGKENLDGKTILLHWEQGFGDTIQFARYGRVLAAKGATVILDVQEELVSAFQGIDGISRIISKNDPVPHFDFHCPLMSLPFALGTTLDSIPSANNLLKLNQDKIQKWQSILGKPDKKRIGIAWSGSASHGNDQNRSIPFADFIVAFSADVELICLQTEIREQDSPLLAGSSVRHFGSEVVDFSDTAVICSLLDEVVAVDTSVVHLAGTLGVKTRALLPFRPDWRWLMSGSDSRWYDSVSLLRQKQPGNWASVLDVINSERLA